MIVYVPQRRGGAAGLEEGERYSYVTGADASPLLRFCIRPNSCGCD